MNLNKVLILGRVTADPQLRTTPGGQSVSGFSIATNRVWTDKNGAKQEDTEFHNVVVWGRQAEIATQFLTKGAMVLIEGRLQTRSWTDKQNQQRKTTEIICERLQLGPRAQGVGPRNNQTNSATSSGQKTTANPTTKAEEIPTINIDETEEVKPEDLPF
ncbi:MAG: single-stranded DNA-binding protein [Candidatus Liptonbacteria bacterium]|nr:single-stranded DNA-binding protein [Candidatus Liptonbacteria bacterium]